jgi:hypothetical protein
VIELCEANRGQQKSIEFFNKDQVILVYDVPAAQLVEDLFGKLKGSRYVVVALIMACNFPLTSPTVKDMPLSIMRKPVGEKANYLKYNYL